MRKIIAMLAILASSSLAQAADVVVIGHTDVPRIDAETVQRIYTGKVISVEGVNVKAVNVKPGSPARDQFLQSFLNQADDKYIAYWTVRRYIGKGAPPIELKDVSEVISYVKTTPGAIGYVPANEAPAGINIVSRK